jgi:hypothetical protein
VLLSADGIGTMVIQRQTGQELLAHAHLPRARGAVTAGLGTTINCWKKLESKMLTIPLETLAYIIIKAREFDAEVAPVDQDSGSNPTDDAARSILEATMQNPTYQELVGAINSLNEPQRVELLALAWLGRGDYAKEESREALTEARRIHDKKETDYLVGTPLLADYIEEGLSQLGYSIEDYEIGRL